jgi:hypothetical protein
MAARKNIVPLDPSTIPLPTSTGFVRSVIERRRRDSKKKKRDQTV